VLQVINSSPGDLAPVFEAILEKALSLCEAVLGSMVRFDGDAFHWVAARGVPEAWFAEFTTAAGYRPTPGIALYRFLHSGENIEHVADIAADDSGRSDIPDRRRFAELSGARTAIWVALRKDQALLGAFVIYRREVRPFSQKQIALLQNFAAQAVIAMENARLITETREALEQQTATAEVLQVINSSPGDLAPVFDAILEKAHTLCGAAHGALMTFDGETARAVAMRGVPEPLARFLLEGFSIWPGSAPEKLVRGERFVHIPDVVALLAEGPSNLARSLTPAAEAGTRTILFVPLRKDNALIGYITATRSEVLRFSDKQIQLLENFAAQAVIAMENARLLTETREALEQQTATAEVLQVINSSPGDLAPVFDAMLEKAVRLCGATTGILRTFDGESFPLAAVHGEPKTVARMKELDSVPPRGTGGDLLGRIVHGERIVHVPDVRETQAYRDFPAARERMETLRIRTWLAVPLHKDDELRGVIVAQRSEVRPFSDREIALLENFATQAVIAMENARLLGELRQRTEEVAELNRGLEARVAAQVEELGRVGRLKRFLAPQLAELIVSQGDEKILESHRREIVVVFCDLRGYTAFTETAEPEEVLEFLREYDGALGPLVSQFEGTLDQFSGDGIMVFFNDPVPCPDPAARAVKMAMAMREAAGKLIADWRRHGCELGFGAGIAQGYATLGQIGFSDRSGYTAIGTVCNLAARLCAEAKDGQILVSSRVARAVEAVVMLEDLGNLELRGLRRPVAAFNVVQSTSPAEGRPNLTVVARGPGV
jgi:adenylate cyclase